MKECENQLATDDTKRQIISMIKEMNTWARVAKR